MSVPRFVNLTTGYGVLPKARTTSTHRRRAGWVVKGWADQYVVRLCGACADELQAGDPLSKPVYGGTCYVCEQQTVVHVYLDRPT